MNLKFTASNTSTPCVCLQSLATKQKIGNADLSNQDRLRNVPEAPRIQWDNSLKQLETVVKLFLSEECAPSLQASERFSQHHIWYQRSGGK